jgi:hypothetical protein
VFEAKNIPAELCSILTASLMIIKINTSIYLSVC